MRFLFVKEDLEVHDLNPTWTAIKISNICARGGTYI